jgi:hypothetical protein
MTVELIRTNIKPVRQAISELQDQADQISGLVVLVCINDDADYDYYIAGSIGAERTIGRLEIIKRALLDKVMFPSGKGT